ncbi:hypothetical protein ACX1C1_23615 [Paenibacillus sp. strain BS8-2]
MRLIGSHREEEIRKQLTVSNQHLFSSEERKKLLQTILFNFPELTTAYIVDWIPEQEEDIFFVLINSDVIAEVELHRINKDEEALVKTHSVKDYLKLSPKSRKLIVLVALDLVKNN